MITAHLEKKYIGKIDLKSEVHPPTVIFREPSSVVALSKKVKSSLKKEVRTYLKDA